ncbi:MAG: HD domain-containing protein, partial [Clostridia bacterium]|nr:HD domain-containing protein [Clostridia bacterium]
MKDPTVLFSALLEIITAAQPKGDINTVKRAYEFAKAAHEGQKRVSGEDYICHPLEVAEIITVMLLDCDTIAAGILHDVIEDTDTTHEDIVAAFGTEIADMVEGVTKLGKIKFTSQEEAQVENLRKMFMATAKDLRVILIKLADRL